MKTASLPQTFIYSAGTLLLAAALGMFFSIEAGRGLIHPHEPLSGISLPAFFCIVGGLELAVALICLFGQNALLQTSLVLWLAINLAVYQAGLWWMGIIGGFKGCLGDVSAAFGVSAGTADLLLKALVLYLLTGSLFSLLWSWKTKLSAKTPDSADSHLKISCPSCGGHIRFASQNLGQKIPCPHCQKETILRKPGLLKMSCYFCKEHIEFPSHAIGHKMRCPHCKNDITLMEQV